MSAIIDLTRSDQPVITIEREFDAARELVWDAITDPAQVSIWYGGPGFTSPICEMDLRPGGHWRHVMQAPGGTRYAINSVFEEVTPPERLVWRTLRDPDRSPAPPTNHNTVTLEALGEERTRWRLVALFDSMADRDLTAQMGFGHMISMGLERMSAHLESLR